MSRRRPNRSLTTVPGPVVIMAAVASVVLAFPLLALLAGAPWSRLWTEITDPATMAAARVSLMVSVTAAIVSVVFGVPLAFTLARRDFWGKPALRTLVTMPLVLPPVVTGVALLAGFGRQSPFGRFFGFGLANSMAGAIVAAVVVAMPFLILSVEGALRGGDEAYEEVAASLGAPALARWWRISLPLARPSIMAGAILSWARALGEFGATITFAGNIEGVSRTLPLEIDTSLDLDPAGDRALALSVLMMVVSLAVLVVMRNRWMPSR